jgi:hypothetical protein
VGCTAREAAARLLAFSLCFGLFLVLTTRRHEKQQQTVGCASGTPCLASLVGTRTLARSLTLTHPLRPPHIQAVTGGGTAGAAREKRGAPGEGGWDAGTDEEGREPKRVRGEDEASGANPPPAAGGAAAVAGAGGAAAHGEGPLGALGRRVSDGAREVGRRVSDGAKAALRAFL